MSATHALSGSRRPTGLDRDHYSFHPRWVYLDMMTTSRTHCHFVMQACALRVPEFCVNHLLPSCLVVYSLAKTRHWFVNTFSLPYPWFNPERFADIPSACSLSAFCQVVRFVHPGSHGSHVTASTSQLASAPRFSVRLRHFQFSDGKAAECAAAVWHH